MKSNLIYTTWNKFIEDNIEHFTTGIDYWNQRLNDVIMYIDNNNKPPTQSSKEDYTRKLGKWLSTPTQKQCSKKRIKMFKSNQIVEKWDEFVEKYSEHLLTNEEMWEINFNALKKFIIENKQKPSISNDNEVLARWTRKQRKKFETRMDIMKSDEIYEKWNEFILDEAFCEYFK